MVSCVAGPHFRPQKSKPRRKESHAEVGLRVPLSSLKVAVLLSSALASGERREELGSQNERTLRFFFFF